MLLVKIVLKVVIYRNFIKFLTTKNVVQNVDAIFGWKIIKTLYSLHPKIFEKRQIVASQPYCTYRRTSLNKKRRFLPYCRYRPPVKLED